MNSNPWSGDLDKYLFYCCPECDDKSENKESFIGHAVTNHPKAKEILCENETLTKLEEPEFMDIENEFDVHIKNEPSDDLLNVNTEVDSIPKCVPVQDLNALKDKGRKFLFVNVKDLEELKCMKCQQIFQSKEFLQKHNQEYHPEVVNSFTKIKCNLCDKILPSKKGLEYHKIKDHHDLLGAGYKCKECGHIAINLQKLRHHVKLNHTLIFKCDQCDYIVPSGIQGSKESNLKTHKIRKHGKHNMEGTKCEMCCIEFVNNNTLLAHLNKTHEIQVNDDVTCEFCGKNIASKCLTRHQRYVHGYYSTGYKCLICDMYLNSKNQEDKHKLEKHDKDLDCEKCNQTFDNLLAFNDHLKACSEDPKNFTCKKCNNGYVWHSTKTLQIHWAEEHQLHKDICDVCGFAGAHKFELRSHARRHNLAAQGHQCHHCGKTFHMPLELSVHLKEDHGQEDSYSYKCSYCTRTFKQLACLKDHINAKHVTSVKHQCDQCEYSTLYRKNLRSHVNVVHKNIKNIACDYCDHRFVSRRDRDKHISTKHPS